MADQERRLFLIFCVRSSNSVIGTKGAFEKNVSGGEEREYKSGVRTIASSIVNLPTNFPLRSVGDASTLTSSAPWSSISTISSLEILAKPEGSLALESVDRDIGMIMGVACYLRFIRDGGDGGRGRSLRNGGASD